MTFIFLTNFAVSCSEQSGNSSTGGISSKGGLEEMREILSDLQLES